MGAVKAQVEFIAIVVFLILIVVVAYTSLMAPDDRTDLPGAIQVKMKAVEGYFNSIGSQVTGEFVRQVEAQGGYEDGVSPGGSVQFISVTVPIWQRCNRSFIPTKESMETMIAERVEDELRQYGPQASKVLGEQVNMDFSKIRVNAAIREKAIMLSIYLPTTIDKYTRREPYNFTYNSNLGMIYNFASDFSTFQGKSRYLENFLIATIYLSEDYEGEQPALPTFDIFYDYNGTVYRSGSVMTYYLSKSINHSITNILFWDDMVDQSDENRQKGFAIKAVEGRQYPELSQENKGIEMMLADGFAINITDDFQAVCEGSFIETVECDAFNWERCLATYNVDYNITYPVVVRVFDEYTGSYFHFAVMASIKDMEPWEC